MRGLVISLIVAIVIFSLILRQRYKEGFLCENGLRSIDSQLTRETNGEWSGCGPRPNGWAKREPWREWNNLADWPRLATWQPWWWTNL